MVTAQEIERGRTKKGGWTRKQLADWGVPWPPPKGWRQALINKTEIPRKKIAIQITDKMLVCGSDKISDVTNEFITPEALAEAIKAIFADSHYTVKIDW